MACKCAPALLALRAEVDARWPGRDKASDGCCGDPAHAARKSDHNPSGGFAHALDIDEDIVSNMGDRPLWALGITLLSDPRIKYLIYEARILYPDGTDRPYSGANAHRHHLHISITAFATHDTRRWLHALNTGDDMPLNDADRKQIKDIVEGVVKDLLPKILDTEGVNSRLDVIVKQTKKP